MSTSSGECGREPVASTTCSPTQRSSPTATVPGSASCPRPLTISIPCAWSRPLQPGIELGDDGVVVRVHAAGVHPAEGRLNPQLRRPCGRCRRLRRRAIAPLVGMHPRCRQVLVLFHQDDRLAQLGRPDGRGVAARRAAEDDHVGQVFGYALVASRIAATTACGFSMCAMCPAPSTTCTVAALPTPSAFEAGTILSSRPQTATAGPPNAASFGRHVDGGLVALDKVPPPAMRSA